MLTRVQNSTTGNTDYLRATFQLRGDDGIIYYYTHMAVDSPAFFGFENKKEYEVKAGQPLGMIGDKLSADNTVPHLHISATPMNNANGTIDRHIGTWLRTLLPQLK